VSDLTFRARSATEIVDGTFRLYREHFVSFLTLSTLVYLPVIALMVPLMGMMNAPAEDPTAMGLTFLAIGLVSVLWYPVMWGALMLSASEHYMGRQIETGEAVRRAFGKFGALLGSWLAKWLIVMLGFFLLIVPGFYFIARFFAIPATVLFENRGVGDSLGRSSALSIGQKGRILGTLALAWIILFGIIIAFSMLATIILGVVLVRGGGEPPTGTSALLMQLPGIFSYILGLPIIVIAEMLLYYDARIRQEGYDIELMTSRLGSTATEAPAH
jgi:hypothetical protein